MVRNNPGSPKAQACHEPESAGTDTSVTVYSRTSFISQSIERLASKKILQTPSSLIKVCSWVHGERKSLLQDSFDQSLWLRRSKSEVFNGGVGGDMLWVGFFFPVKLEHWCKGDGIMKTMEDALSRTFHSSARQLKCGQIWVLQQDNKAACGMDKAGLTLSFWSLNANVNVYIVHKIRSVPGNQGI